MDLEEIQKPTGVTHRTTIFISVPCCSRAAGGRRAHALPPGRGILEVGVGTGLSLPLYPRDVRVTGIDISREMLARADARRRAVTSTTSWHCVAWTPSAWISRTTASTRRWRCTSPPWCRALRA